MTFHARALYIPLLVLFRAQGVAIHDVDDVRLMAWALTPSDPCGDFDALCAAHFIEVPSPKVCTLEGSVLRMPCVALLYGALMKHLDPLDDSASRRPPRRQCLATTPSPTVPRDSAAVSSTTVKSTVKSTLSAKTKP